MWDSTTEAAQCDRSTPTIQPEKSTRSSPRAEWRRHSRRSLTSGKHMDSTGFDDHRIDASHEFLMFVTEEGGERTQVSTFEEHIVKDGQLIELVYRSIE